MKLDIGCGKNKKEGFVGVDQYPMPGVDHLWDFKVLAHWPFAATAEVEEVHCSHFLEHLPATGRIHFFNELYRVMKPGAKATVIVPHWGSNRAYGDPTHQWPPVSEMAFFYLNSEWRKANAPHTDVEWWDLGYSCDFDATWGYSLHPALLSRNQEFQQFAVANYKEACLDTIVTLIRRT